MDNRLKYYVVASITAKRAGQTQVAASRLSQRGFYNAQHKIFDVHY